MRDWKNEAKKLREKLAKDMVKYWDEAIEFLMDFQNTETDLGIVDEFIIDEMVKHQAEEYGWTRVACFLSEVIHCLNQDYYRVDGYGNLDIITYNTIDCWLGDIADGSI